MITELNACLHIPWVFLTQRMQSWPQKGISGMHWPEKLVRISWIILIGKEPSKRLAEAQSLRLISGPYVTT